MASTIGYWRDIDDLNRLLRDDEEVMRMAAGAHGGASGVLVLTSNRVLFAGSGSVRWAVRNASVVGAHWVGGLQRGALRLRTEVGEFAIQNVVRSDGCSFAEGVADLTRCGPAHQVNRTA